mmetsp:Transcript_60990/g.108416  ORF Transcript_60990/g.108416 Transcript_60990/m.108416 type:complete len:305 (-) Transcript_60990:110-1024(-)
MAGDGFPQLQQAESLLDAKQLEEFLHAGIMSRVDDVLAQQEHALWHRGQEEIAQLHQERQQADLILKDLQKRQDVLVKEQEDMQCALKVITDHLEQVSMEFFEAVRTSGIGAGSVPGMPAVSLDNDKAFNDLAPSDCQQSFSSPFSMPPLPAPLPVPPAGVDQIGMPQYGVAAQAAAMAAAAAAAIGLPPASAAAAAAAAALEHGESSPGGDPRTPPRVRAESATPGAQPSAQLPSMPQVGNSLPILSLASALSPDTPPRPAPPGPSRLNIAACLEAEAVSKPLPLQLRAEAPAFVPGANTEAR